MPYGNNSSGSDDKNAQAIGLTEAELRELARKVMELLKRDLAVERDRFGRSKTQKS